MAVVFGVDSNLVGVGTVSGLLVAVFIATLQDRRDSTRRIDTANAKSQAVVEAALAEEREAHRRTQARVHELEALVTTLGGQL